MPCKSGIIAKKVGLSVDAIRFYERNALLPRPARTQGGFRQYGATVNGVANRPGSGFDSKTQGGIIGISCYAACGRKSLHPEVRMRLAHDWLLPKTCVTSLGFV